MENNMVNNPSTEGKAPENNTSGTTLASTATTSTTSTTATDTTKATATAQINSGTTPATIPANGETAAPEQNTNTATLSVDYLKGGYFRGEGKGRYKAPELEDYAEIIAKALAESGTPASAVKKMARTLKKVAGPRFPFPAKQAALKALKPQVLDLEHRKKAPALLRLVVERNQAAVENDADFSVCVEHIQHIAIYLADEQG